METFTQIPVSFTASAIAEIKRLYQQQPANRYLRVGAKGGGCSGLTYVLDFDERKEQDETFDIAGIPCVMEKSHGLYLMGMEIDWDNGLSNRGFTFSNPNASKTCGCGTSFAV
ncbi:MAG TPA: iron-sulfur cluster assembly accessory protein [Lacibacter sp.]|nr:iron-sulfur cluster assembly accessory protein [Lacibacter sp.]HMO89729.1 iron-sulfur cluster assembly accessory protein [Lacibacter sp.]HMP86883.1 iron-sulfur cluster assembly accessory protein [Lacibacter sp.]